MPSGRMRGVVRELRQRALSQRALIDSALSDGELLERYLAGHANAAGADTAFAALVRRHGPMVLGVCRRIVGNAHDADDAFQATFLVLVRRAACIKPRERVGAWLYGVAYRTALKAKAMCQRRLKKQQPLADVQAPAMPSDGEWLTLLDREIQRLPDKYRLPIVLCDLEGKTRKQAAASLGWPEGTVATRLRDGRALVQKRLARHGLAATGAAASFAWGQALSAITVPAPLSSATIQLAWVLASGKAAGLVPLNILALAEGVLQAMMFTKLKSATAVVILFAVLGVGLHGLAGQDAPAADQAPVEGRRTPEYAPPQVPMAAAALEENNGKLPTGPAPLQALVRLDRDEVVVRTNQPVYRPRTVIDNEQQSRTVYEVIFMLRTDRHDQREVEIYDTKRRKLEAKDWAKRLNKEIPALVVYGLRHIDPLHLRLVKEGTLIVALPERQVVPPSPPVSAVPPAVPIVLPLAPAVPPVDFPPVQGFPAPAQVVPAPVQIPPTASLAPQSVPPAIRRDATISEAERDMDIAAFYLRSGKRESATFYYELVCRRWPGTMYAERAQAVLHELRESKTPASSAPPAPARQATPPRVGQIIITGNKSVPDTVILGNLPLYPGQVLNYADVRAAEEKLRSMKEFTSAGAIVNLRPSVTVIDSDGPYRDILINVHETISLDVLNELKRLEGAWTIEAATVMGKAIPHMVGGEMTFAGDELVSKNSSKTSRYRVTVDIAKRPKRIRLRPLDESSPAGFADGSYDLADDTLTLTIQTTLSANSEGKSADNAVRLTLKRAPVPSAVQMWRESLPKIAAAAPIRFEDRVKKLAFAASDMKILPDNRLLLTKCVLLRMASGNEPPQHLKAERMILTLDGPIASLEDLRKRTIVSIDMQGPGVVEE